MEGYPPGPRLPRTLQGLRMLATEHRMLERYRRRWGDVFTLNLWPFERLVVVSDPAEVKRIFQGDPHELHAGEGNRVLEPLVGSESVLLLDDDEHLRRRKLLLPAFHGERMRVYGELMREIADAEIDAWPLRSEFPVHASMQRITLRVIVRAVFGVEDDARALELEELLVQVTELGQRVLMVPPLQRDFGGHGPWYRVGQVGERVDALLYDEIARRRSAPDADATDILSMLVAGSDLTDEQLRDELMTLLVAGHETTATGMSWVVERVLRHPPVHARLCAELADGEDGYLDCVIKEALRVRPVITYVMRTLKSPMDVAGYTIPTGATLGTSILLIHRRADLYPEPYAFRPERFEESPPDTYGWLPFGGGVRRCLGAAFAGFEMKQVLTQVFGRLDLRVADPRPERQARRAITFVPARGARVVVDARVPAVAPAVPIPA
ncbi:MAG: cytochrome [Solirubrobacterales bacterium]|jgi:cytochrome P450|nr:cytochrome [Solirubrobacterales bacterium]